MPDMIPVDSSNLQAYGYDPDAQELYIDFLNGSRYKYLDVPEDVWEEFQNAESKGSFLHWSIKQAGYQYERIW